MKFKAPTLGIGMRRIFRRHGYTVLLVDEFRTSCRCHACYSETEKFLKVKDPRPFKQCQGHIKEREVHGLLRCKSVQCKRVWNRDRNGSSNIRSIACDALKGIPRNYIFSRSNKNLQEIIRQGPPCTNAAHEGRPLQPCNDGNPVL